MSKEKQKLFCSLFGQVRMMPCKLGCHQIIAATRQCRDLLNPKQLYCRATVRTRLIKIWVWQINVYWGRMVLCLVMAFWVKEEVNLIATVYHASNHTFVLFPPSNMARITLAKCLLDVYYQGMEILTLNRGVISWKPYRWQLLLL